MASLNQMTQHAAYKPWKYTSASEKNDERVECRRSLRGSISKIRREREKDQKPVHFATQQRQILSVELYIDIGTLCLALGLFPLRLVFLLFGILLGFYLVLPKKDENK